MVRIFPFAAFVTAISLTIAAQEKSVNPGINDPFKDPDVAKYSKIFEGESREVYQHRDKVVEELGLKPGMVVADIGAGTGLYTRLMAQKVGPTGQVYAVDIAPKFLEHIQKTCRQAGLLNITPVLCNVDAVDLPPNSVDVAFICDAYHHFEFPEKTMLSLRRALKPQGRVAIIDFRRIPGESSDWILKHVRAGQDVFEKEIISCGFQKIHEVRGLLKENYFVIFSPSVPPAPPSGSVKRVTPVIPGYGAVVPMPDAVEPPKKGSKFVFDVTGKAQDATQPLPGLVRAATLLNLAGVSGLKPTDVDIVVVLHGDATSAALSNDAYQHIHGVKHPHAELIALLHSAGVKLLVCGQALARKGYDPKQVRPDVSIAVSAVTAVANYQSRGYSYILVP